MEKIKPYPELGSYEMDHPDFGKIVLFQMTCPCDYDRRTDDWNDFLETKFTMFGDDFEVVALELHAVNIIRKGKVIGVAVRKVKD